LEVVVDKILEINTTQAAASTDDRSPSAIFSDQLLMNSNGKGIIFNVSIKDQ